MEKPLTVYFDTNFFVQLCKVDVATAGKVLSELNSLNVRHVLSNMIMWELLSSSDRTERDKILYERINIFEIQPYRTDTYSDWQMLLLEGQQRLALANLYKSLDDMTTVAENWSIVAHQSFSSANKKTIRLQTTRLQLKKMKRNALLLCSRRQSCSISHSDHRFC